MKRLLSLIYGVACYAVFFVTFLYAIGFVGNLVVPKSIDSPAEGSLAGALLIDLLLLAVFAVQHSVMARPGFKRAWTRIVPVHLERSTYVLFASLALILLFRFWQPIGGVVWDVQDPIGKALLYGLFAFGWSLVLVTTFLINHFDLFGLRQVWLNFRGQRYTNVDFVMPGPYRLIRHPLYAGFICAMWPTPLMTITHLVFAIGTTAYILIAIQFEERDLAAALGDSYKAYRRRVPMLVPRPKREDLTTETSTRA